MSNSTAQYYHDSALRLGLVDSERGIRMREEDKNNDNNRDGNDNKSVVKKEVPDGISFLMIAAASKRPHPVDGPHQYHHYDNNQNFPTNNTTTLQPIAPRKVA